MSENILVAVAWPYANSQIHVGNVTGSYLPADIFARYQRLSGNRVLMVSGSDAHGTPVTVSADAENTTPLLVYQKYHASFLELYQKLGLTYDLFTSTHTENHFNVSQALFLALKQNKCIYAEIAIMAKENNCIVFIEVKTRKTGGEILPEDSVNYAKERRLTKAAEYYINGLDYYDGDFRFDVVSIIVNNNKPQITIITDAF